MDQKTIKVGISEFSPLVIKEDGKYNGFEIELWERIARELKLEYSYSEYLFKDLLPSLAQKKIDVAIAGITMTEAREKAVDFSHDTFNSGLRILVPDKIRFNLPTFLGSIFTKNTVIIFGVLIAFLVVVSHLIWLAERQGGGSLAGPYIPGIFNALWWGIVTIATVGYGDYTPVSYLGRLLASLVILAGLIIVGFYIAQISSTLTIRSFKSSISNYKDLNGKTVATQEGTTSEKFLRDIGAVARPVMRIGEAFKKLENNEVQAVVFDSPVILHYAAGVGRGKVRVVGEIFQEQSYGICVQQKSELLESINRMLLKLYDSGEYDALYKKWFGTSR